MDTADESCVIRWITDRTQLHFATRRLERNCRTAYSKFTDAALTQSATDCDALDVLPFLESQEAPDDRSKLLCEFLDGAMNGAGCFDVTFGQQFVELLLGEFVARRIAKRIFTCLTHLLAPFVQDALKRSLARAVAYKPFLCAEFRVVVIDHDLTQRLGTVRQRQPG